MVLGRYLKWLGTLTVRVMKRVYKLKAKPHPMDGSTIMALVYRPQTQTEEP